MEPQALPPTIDLVNSDSSPPSSDSRPSWDPWLVLGGARFAVVLLVVWALLDKPMDPAYTAYVFGGTKPQE